MEKTDQSLRKAVVRALEIATGNPPLSVASPEFQASIYSAQFFDAILTEKIKTEEQGPAEVVLEMAKALQRLVYLVRDPEHVVNLFDESLRSAHDVAILSREGFVEKMVKTYKMKEDAAKRIHDHATNIDCRNQETWAQILSSLKNDFVVGVKKPATTSKPPGGSSNVATAKAYNLVDMFKLQFNECEDCCSVFGASAYFQDLMQFLQSLPLQGAPKDRNQPGARNVLEALTSRRPDLKDLELTCANSAKKVPYITLVNEVLESYATSLQSQQAKEKLDKGSIILVKAFNEYDTNIMNVSPAASESRKSSTGDSSASPLWSTNMVSQLFPFRTFPYSLAKDTIETSLSNFDMSIKNLFTLFGPSQRLLALQGEPSTTIYRRAKASSALGLSQEDFFAITGEKLYAAEAPAQRWQETPWSGPAAHTMWGYSSSAAMIDTDEVAESGLCFVQKQLLPRSGVSFTELVELLQTLYFGGRLALINKKEEFKYESSAISELRLRALNRSVSEETVTTLNDGLCIELQAFLRLKARTGWSIADLDAAVSTVSQRLSNSASTGSPDICGRGISAPIVEELGTIFELSELVSKPVAELLPLWGIIHIRGSKSLYHKLCFSTAAERIGDPVFRIPVSDSRITAMPLRDADEIWKHKPILQVVLRVSADDLEELRKATGLTSSRVNLSLDNFTRLYRYRTLCSLLKIKPKLLSALREALPANLDIFHSPAVTLRFTRQWYQLLETQWTPDEIIKTLKQSQGQELSEDSEVKSATSSLMADLNDVTRRVESEWQPKTSDGAPTNEDMDYICDLILGDRDWASQVSKFVQGTLEASAPAPRGYSALPQDIPLRIRLTRTVNDAGFRLTLNGLLSQDEKRKTFELLHEDSAAILDIVKRLDDELRDFINMLQLQPLSSPNEQDLKFLVTPLCNLMGWPAPTVNDVLTERYKRISTRQVFDGFKGSAGIVELADLVRAAKGLMPLHGQLPIKLLLQVLDPNQPAGGSQETYESIARNVQSALTDSQRSRLGKEINGRKRRALVEYLLQQEHLKTNLGMASPDDLYEHLLIDVQMGPELETARTKQAVSTIQLFMQRCLMGLEASRGVVSSDIRQAEWAWRQQHSVWQAARRVFLYPENWLEPSIRDDKTPLFREYETRIQQQDLSWESFIASMKGYAQGLCDIADLDIQAYLRQPGSDSSDTFHLFGRTRNAPYMFFYRRMRVNRASVSIINPKSTWSAWKLMELDTLTYETDWNGNTLPQGGTYIIPVMRRNRLFLYLPQISVKAATARYQVPSTYQDIAKKPIKEATPQKYWEIRIAWTELYDGKWSPKRVSQSSLVVQPNTGLPANAALPSIGSFVFEVLPSVASDSDPTTPDETSIRVGCWNAPNVSYYMLGSFSIKDDRVLAVPASSPNTNLGPTLLTTFHKYSWTDSSRSEEPTTPPGVVRAGKDLTKDQSPLLAIPYGSKTESRQLTWTLSYGGDKSRDVTGMFVDEIRGSQRSATVFMWPTAADGIPAEFPSSTVYSQSKTVTVIHDYARRLVEAASVSENNIDYLFEKIHTTQLGQVSSAQAARPSLDFGMEISDKFAAGRHELTTPYAIYNWELGLHTVLLAAERFQATQQFDLALRAMKFIFDPTAKAIGKLDDPNAVAIACWKFPPFKEVAAMKDKMRDGFSRWPDNLASDSQSSDLSMAIAERRSNPLNAHATARGRTQAYMKWVIFKYVELLIAAGDVYFRRGSLEALPLAIQRYVEASYILGPLPEKVPKLGQPKEPLTFSTFKDEIDLELEFPFICALSRRGSASAALVNGKEQSLLCLLRSPYFCLPANPKYKQLRDVLEDRFYKTRNSLDINGRPIVYSIDEPYLDPARLLAGYGFTSGPGGVLDLLSGSQNAPVPYARFQITVGRALEMCTEVRSMMEQLLAVREKRDGEALALLKARQDVKRQDLLLGLKKLGYEELQITLESLEAQRDSNVSQLAHYLKLLGEDEKKIPKDEKAEWEDIAYEIDKPTSDHLRMSPYEQIEFEESQKAADLTEGSTIRDEIVSGLRMLPSISEQIMPMGMGVTMRVDSHLFADALEIKSKIDRVRALMATNKSQTAARINGLTRQLQERALQANVKGREIKALDKQIAAQKKRMETSEREQALQQREMEWCNEVQTWYQEKFSSEKLYAFMENQLRTIAYDVYQTALDLARLAERAFQYERPTWSTGSTGSSLMAGSRVGIFAAQRLALDLRRMQIAYIERPSFDYQISKTVSLRQIDPVALTRLQETGTATFEVPELYFDMDFPGHYMRRLRSVAVSIPAIVGPFTSIAASLVLTSHKYRVSDNVNDKSSDGTGDGSQFRTDKTPITAIAVSSGYQDSGIFDMTSAGEQLAPFEGAGVISSWRLELPKTAVRQFDYRTISDVMLHMKYTSLQGGPKLKQAATESVNKLVAGVEQLGLQDGLLASFSLKADFSNDWHHAQTELRKKAGANPPDSKPLRLALNGLQSRLPFWTRGSAITVRSVSLVILHSTQVTQAQVTKDATSIKLVTSTDSKSIEWDRKESIERSTLLTKDDLQGTKLDDGWELLIASSPDVNDIYLIMKYSTGSE
ncbi:hypothetical protein EJ04DRAFT_596291 [Polyplosphaeria fusca]|uniref:Uncharacterized protein n=1 Tax=Polyplosphaeria fusca TaxID=682080 RepID=A0A9P4QLC8_9PLEO|nr:hypothetical protein EJ04DRAFT_596291 [Polyplosphaeria fusca]